ncbi:MAG: KUP/HAK/KT family potassium transporter, partial [Bradyrhizobium sp.]
MSKRQTSAGSEVGPDRQRRLASLGLSALGVVFGDIGTMGHFGAPAIKLAWFAIVFPGLILNYAGQAALVLDGAPTDGNIFFRLCRDVLLLPLIVLATVATIIAS